jgi:hypothetical protein
MKIVVEVDEWCRNPFDYLLNLPVPKVHLLQTTPWTRQVTLYRNGIVNWNDLRGLIGLTGI